MDSINRILEDGIEIESVYQKKRGIVLLRRYNDLLYISGHGPEDQRTGEPLFKGRVGGELTAEQGYQAARECAVILLGVLKDTLGTLEKVKRIVKAFALVNCDNGFNDIDSVMDGFSDTMAEALEERGYHARTAMGTHNMPNGNIPVEVELIVQVDE